VGGREEWGLDSGCALAMGRVGAHLKVARIVGIVGLVLCLSYHPNHLHRGQFSGLGSPLFFAKEMNIWIYYLPRYLRHQNAEAMEVGVREMLHVDEIGIGRGRHVEAMVFLKENEKETANWTHEL